MRWTSTLILAAGAWCAWQAMHRPVPPPPAPDVAAGPVAIVRTEPTELSFLERLRSGQWSEHEPAPDPAVRCVLPDENAYVRQSECERRGGHADEPGWAQ
jgi:hypothetical protein